MNAHTLTQHLIVPRTLALVGAVALSGIACARQPPPAQLTLPGAVQASATAPATPIAVNCGTGQQPLITSVLVNAQAVSQVECVAIAAPAPALAATGALPLTGATAVSYAPSGRAVPADLETMRIDERPVYREAARPASYRTAEYPAERRPVASGRAWKKSALIIGSSAGIGAGVGAAAGGKKGALIGAALGGGGATIWDQVTRRR